jgi:hypothetical protein
VQKIKIYLILLWVLAGLSLVALLWLTNVFAPDKTSVIVVFYILTASMGFAITTLVGFHLRKLFGQRELLNNYIATAARQGIWLSLILIISLILVHLGWFSWLNAAFLVLAFVFFESYLITKNHG